jgi:hypothetical protein
MAEDTRSDEQVEKDNKAEQRRAQISQERGARIARKGQRLSVEDRTALVAKQGELERKKGSAGSMQDVEKLNENEGLQEAAGLSFKAGGTAKHTGTYKLHKGEKVISMNSTRAAIHLGGAKKSSNKKSSSKKRHVHRMEIRHGASGGHIITHHFKPEEDENGNMQTPESEEHIMPPSEGNEMLAQHVAEHMAPPPEAAPTEQVAGQPVVNPSEGR